MTVRVSELRGLGLVATEEQGFSLQYGLTSSSRLAWTNAASSGTSSSTKLPGNIGTSQKSCLTKCLRQLDAYGSRPTTPSGER